MPLLELPVPQKATWAEAIAETALFRLARCEEALRRAIQILEDVKEGKIPDDIDDHIAYLASVETPEECRP